MGHKDVGLDPNILSGLDARLAGSASEDFFSQRHKAG
jgi:hypothetical protein